MTKKAIRRGSVRKSLSEDAKKARMEQWAVRLGLPKDTAQKMIDKYGPYAYQIMEKAMLQPMNIKPIIDPTWRGNQGFRSSSGCVKYLVDNTLSTAQIARITGKSTAEVEENLNNYTSEVTTPTAEEERAAEAAKRMDSRVDDNLAPTTFPTNTNTEDYISEFTIQNMPTTPAKNKTDLQNQAYENFSKSEAKRADIYLDCKGHPTTGIGHLIFHLDDLNNKTKMQAWKQQYLNTCDYPGMTKTEQGQLFDKLAEQMRIAKNYQKAHSCTLDVALSHTTLGAKNVAGAGWDLTAPYIQKAKLDEAGIKKAFNSDFNYWYKRTKEKLPQLDNYPLPVQLSAIHTAFAGQLGRLDSAECRRSTKKLVERITLTRSPAKVPAAEGDTINIARRCVDLPPAISRSNSRASSSRRSSRKSRRR